eukprot:CAMPEP_0172011570 /NCGR_PEP_ID=MMETSP1041-20130122/8358_1 /TAXON_ID=464988 /ORGANISM="Hemiselmis andersenii, Strain CCMP439" /LENGTH=198 /DNA_ID=CAMNT_0012666055 /DNA_START=90 /DNA_END=686 /DNA_ORIENTATION=+
MQCPLLSAHAAARVGGGDGDDDTVRLSEPTPGGGVGGPLALAQGAVVARNHAHLEALPHIRVSWGPRELQRGPLARARPSRVIVNRVVLVRVLARNLIAGQADVLGLTVDRAGASPHYHVGGHARVLQHEEGHLVFGVGVRGDEGDVKLLPRPYGDVAVRRLVSSCLPCIKVVTGGPADGRTVVDALLPPVGGAEAAL